MIINYTKPLSAYEITNACVERFPSLGQAGARERQQRKKTFESLHSHRTLGGRVLFFNKLSPSLILASPPSS